MELFEVAKGDDWATLLRGETQGGVELNRVDD